MFSFPNRPPALSRGLGAFPIPCGSLPAKADSGALTPPSRGAQRQSVPCCAVAAGRARHPRPVCLRMQAPRSLTPLPAGHTASAPALIQLGRPPPYGRLPVVRPAFFLPATPASSRVIVV